MWEEWSNSGPDVKILGGTDSQGSGFSPLVGDPMTALPLDCPEVFGNHHQVMASAERHDSFWQDKSSSCFVNLHMWTDKLLPGRFDLGSPLISDMPEGVLLTPPAEPSWVPENETGEKMGVFSDDLPQEPQEEKEILTCLWIGCNTTLESQKALVEHIERAHVEGRRDDFNCFWLGCPRRNRPFNARYKLMIHMRVHTGFKPNICSYPSCSKAFSRLENLKIHYRSHTGERPYVCPHCTKAFSNSSDRAKHQRTHFDTKPYACTHPNCGKRYTDPSSLRKHAKMHFVGMATSAPVPIQKTGLERNIHRSNYAQSLSPSPPATPCTPLTPQSPVVQPTLFSSSAPGALAYSDFEEPKCTFTFPETSVVDDFMVELDWMAAMDLEDIEQILSSDAN